MKWLSRSTEMNLGNDFKKFQAVTRPLAQIIKSKDPTTIMKFKAKQFFNVKSANG